MTAAKRTQDGLSVVRLANHQLSKPIADRIRGQGEAKRIRDAGMECTVRVGRADSSSLSKVMA